MTLHRTLLCALLALAVAAALAPRADAALRLNEILPGPATDWDGSGVFSSRDDEWVEVVNTGPAALDLSPFMLTDAAGTPRFRFTGFLGAGERLVVFGSDSYAWERDSGHPAFGLSLGNSGDSVMLWQIGASDTMLIEHYAYLSHEAATDRAIGRRPDAEGAWSLFDGLNPYSGTTEPHGNGCAPSPGTPNQCDSTPVESGSWGRLKTLYR